MDTDKIYSEICVSILLNWKEISQNKKYMEILDMEKNKLCKYFKSMNPTSTDKYVQAHALTSMIISQIIM